MARLYFDLLWLFANCQFMLLAQEVPFDHCSVDANLQYAIAALQPHGDYIHVDVNETFVKSHSPEIYDLAMTGDPNAACPVASGEHHFQNISGLTEFQIPTTSLDGKTNSLCLVLFDAHTAARVASGFVVCFKPATTTTPVPILFTKIHHGSNHLETYSDAGLSSAWTYESGAPAAGSIAIGTTIEYRLALIRSKSFFKTFMPLECYMYDENDGSRVWFVKGGCGCLETTPCYGNFLPYRLQDTGGELVFIQPLKVFKFVNADSLKVWCNVKLCESQIDANCKSDC